VEFILSYNIKHYLMFLLEASKGRALADALDRGNNFT
jgi:hypothetical protein